jgi:hypothetical protein
MDTQLSPVRVLALAATGAVLAAVLACKGDRVAPVLESSYPADGATGVPTNVQVRVTFSEPMDQAATQAAFGIEPAAPGEFTWQGSSLFWRPDTNLARRSSWVITVGTDARDRAGNRLESPLSFTFTTGDSTTAAVTVHMLGRSVMGGWFEHWGGSPSTQGRFTFIYHEVQSPPDYVASVVEAIESIPAAPGTVVFFKLCFADFEGGDSATAQANLDRNIGYVEEAYQAALGRGLPVIVGNALPQVAQYTDAWLVWNHRQYNQAVAAVEAGKPDVVAVFDQYSILTDAGGNLKSSYASAPGDAHLNDAAYNALDAAFFPLLEQNY